MCTHPPVDVLPAHRPLRLTQPQPFRLQTEARGVLHEREMAAKLAADEAKAKRLRRVTARPLPVTLDVPVVPHRPDPKPLTLPDPFELKSMVCGSAVLAVCNTGQRVGDAQPTAIVLC